MDILNRTKSMNDDGELAVASYQYVEEENFWLNKLSGEQEKTFIPYDYKISVIPDFHQNSFKFVLKDRLLENLLRISSGSHPRLHMVLTAGLCLLLKKYTGHEDIMLGVPIYKQEADADFINTVLTVRTVLQNCMTFKELVLHVRQTIVEADENQNYPIEMLLRKLKLPFTGNDFPLFDVALLLKNIHERKYLDPVNPNMIFSFLEKGKCIEGELEYHPLLYSRETIERVVECYIHGLGEALLNINAPISQIDILPEEEKNRLLLNFCRTGSEYHGERTILGLFVQQSRRNPGKVAVKFKYENVTYRHLNQRSNQLARFLRKKGIKPGTILGVIIRPSIDVIITLLGILKANGAYLPIDPDLPQERVMTMLRDSGTPIILTNLEVLERFSFISLWNFKYNHIGPRLNAPRQQIKDLDQLPIPDRSLVNYGKYNQFIAEAPAKHTVTLQGTRGCPFNCAFCHRIWPKNHVFRTAEHLFSEVKRLYQVGVRRFEFVDDIFNLNKKNSRQFFELIIKNGLKVQLFFTSGLRGDILTTEDIDLMVEAGTMDFDFSLESASPRIQKLIRKNLKIDRLKKNIQYIIDNHPQVIIELQTMHGIPTETEAEAMMTFEFIKGLKWMDFPYVHLLRIFPETDMAKIALGNGITMEAIEESAKLAFHELSPTLPFPREFTKLYQLKYLHEYFLSKERLLVVLPKQMKLLTENELVQKYDSFFPTDIRNFQDLLEVMGIKRNELGDVVFLPKDYMAVPNIDENLAKVFPRQTPEPNTLRVMLLDISLYFSDHSKILYDVVNEPLGLMYILTALNHDYPKKIHGKIAKSRIDFNSFKELQLLINDFQPDVIGIRSMSFYKDFFHLTVSLIRQWGFDGIVIAGGPYATSNPRIVLKDTGVDVVVVGEGEKTFSELIGKIMENDGKLPGESVLKQIDGIAFMEESQRRQWERLRPKVVLLDQILHLLTKESTADLEEKSGPRDPAYIIYTSGSTGLPKGVMVEHRNLHAYVNAFLQEFDISSQDNVIVQSSYAFDTFVEEVYPALLRGGAVVMGTREEILDIERLCRLIARQQVTVFGGTPLLLNELNKYVSTSLSNLLPSIHTFISGGDVLKENQVDRLVKIAVLYNTYGPTETTVCATYYKYSPGKTSLLPIGRPIANYSVYIVDKEIRLLAIGAAGELVISGKGVSRGYLNRPHLTAAAFIKNPFNSLQKLYKTGDLSRWLPDSNIEFLGRLDNQVKIRGYRIELEEIENCLLKHQGITDAVVMVRGDRDKYLCAYIVAKEKLSAGELQTFLSGRTPYYMIPAYFVFLERLPLNPNKKVDRKALPEPGLLVRESYTSPRNEVEEKLVKIWQEVLGQEKIGIHDNFFELGGNSMHLIIVNNKLKALEENPIPVVNMFRYPTIHSLAKLLGQEKVSPHTSPEQIEQSMNTMEETMRILSGDEHE